MRRLTLLLVASLAVGCSGGSSSPSSPTPSSPTSPSTSSTPAVVTTAGVSAAATLTSSGVTYTTTFTARETSGQTGLTISSIRIALSNATRSGGATFGSADNITTKLVAGGSQLYILSVNSTNTTDFYDTVSAVISYTDDRGVAGTFTSPAASIPPPGTTSSSATYDVTLSATCTRTGKNSNGQTVFTIAESGTATSPDAGAFLDIALIQGIGGTVTCGSWSPDSGVTCRRGSGQPTTSTWTATTTNYPALSSEELAVNLNDSTGHQKARKTLTVSCAAN